MMDPLKLEENLFETCINIFQWMMSLKIIKIFSLNKPVPRCLMKNLANQIPRLFGSTLPRDFSATHHQLIFALTKSMIALEQENGIVMFVSCIQNMWLKFLAPR